MVYLVLWVRSYKIHTPFFSHKPITGPLSNAPIDTIKTRIQKSSATGSGWERFKVVTTEIWQKEGFKAFYKGLTPRVLRVAPGQAVTFMVYEKVKTWLEVFQKKIENGEVKSLVVSPQK